MVGGCSKSFVLEWNAKLVQIIQEPTKCLILLLIQPRTCRFARRPRLSPSSEASANLILMNPEVALQEAVGYCRMLLLVFDGIFKRLLLIVVR